jgi:hypothetical protein
VEEEMEVCVGDDKQKCTDVHISSRFVAATQHTKVFGGIVLVLVVNTFKSEKKLRVHSY